MREVRNSLLRRRFLVDFIQNGRKFQNLINSNMKILRNYFVFYKYKEFFYLGKRNPISSNLSTHKVSAHYRYRKWRKGKEYTCVQVEGLHRDRGGERGKEKAAHLVAVAENLHRCQRYHLASSRKIRIWLLPPTHQIENPAKWHEKAIM